MSVEREYTVNTKNQLSRYIFPKSYRILSVDVFTYNITCSCRKFELAVGGDICKMTKNG